MALLIFVVVVGFFFWGAGAEMNFRGRFFFEFDISKKIGGMNLCQMRCLSDGFAVAIEYGFVPNKLPKHLGETHRKKLHPDG